MNLAGILAALLAGLGCVSTPTQGTHIMKTIVLTPSTSELPAGWSPDDFRDLVRRAASRWSYPHVPCRVQVVVGDARPEWRAVQDGTNLIAVRSRSWCHNARCSPTTTYSLRATAMTTTYPEGARGRSVVEGDVEVNGVFFQLTDSRATTQPDMRRRPVRLESILLHEIGHVLGLGDVCGDDRTESGRPDTAGCSPEDRARAMFASGQHEDLTADDVRDLCRIFPPAASPASGAPQ